MTKTTRRGIMHCLSIPLRFVCAAVLFSVAQQVSAINLAPCNPSRADYSLYQTESNRPQWQDVGLQDILMVDGQSTVTAPNHVRTAHDTGAQGCLCSHMELNRTYHCDSVAVRPNRQPRGSLYMWHFLRL